MKGQKEFVVDMIKTMVPGFQVGKDIALLSLTHDQLEYIKSTVGAAMISGDVEYSKDRTNSAEVYSYARSMVMNHLKKAKELNGGNTYKVANTGRGSIKSKITQPIPSVIKTELLTEELKEYVKTLYN